MPRSRPVGESQAHAVTEDRMQSQRSLRLSGKDVQDIRKKMPASIFQAQWELYRAIRQDTSIDKPLRELLRLKSAQLAHCVH